MLIEEFESIQIQFHRTPGVGFQQVMKIIDQLLFRKSIDFRLKILTDAPDSARISLDGFGL